MTAPFGIAELHIPVLMIDMSRNGQRLASLEGACHVYEFITWETEKWSQPKPALPFACSWRQFWR
jgi:hypothetical protein